jgi:hypothetical protein
MTERSEPISKAEDKKPEEVVEDVPDPDEDDLDDLDGEPINRSSEPNERV